MLESPYRLLPKPSTKERIFVYDKKDIDLLKLIQKDGCMCDINYFRTLDISADVRLDHLEKIGYIKKHIHNHNLEYAGDYEITASGIAFLKDYRDEQVHNWIVFILTNFLLPTVVAFITACITHNSLP